MQFRKVLVVLLLAVAGAQAMAQRGGGRGGGSPVQMALIPDVATELGLSDDQKTKLTELRDSVRQQSTQARQDANGDQDAMRKAMTAINAKAIEEMNKILTPDQQKRLKEIRLQMAGFGAVTQKEVQDELGLTEDQKTKIADLVKTQTEANAAIQEKVTSGEIQRQDAGPMRTKNTQALHDGIEKILTDDQKAKLKAMGGKPFALKPPAGGGGGGLN